MVRHLPRFPPSQSSGRQARTKRLPKRGGKRRDRSPHAFPGSSQRRIGSPFAETTRVLSALLMFERFAKALKVVELERQIGFAYVEVRRAEKAAKDAKAGKDHAAAM